ncbi:hypothetical protein W97_00229 [Coniosporium apollinis CBS 100218]|uniref:EamA domain-containing protein n=1 Tax=Coniosporium apollinis (strain CBS 100218) TaxID=1168221 RepID=R7YGS4_CONA1|nr:uncharacterized protein W97_00229 [Coniosporium apollinis CBS 100218]EON61019.1 hypothetical protein W97_00229 [Coniosporium apollinis CBS 100218]
MNVFRGRTAWLALAIASGACASFNGVFAKLTTTELTTTWASALSTFLSLSPTNKPIEYLFRGFFFALNLLFNAIMWALFTRALTLASSTVRVSIINTSANFMLTAVLGALIFSETLPGLWWVGAGMLVVGSVVIGGREEGEGKKVGSTGMEGTEGEAGDRFRDEPAIGDGEEEEGAKASLELGRVSADGDRR